jgi:hypothetical protein
MRGCTMCPATVVGRLVERFLVLCLLSMIFGFALRERQAIRGRSWKLIRTGSGRDGSGAAPLEKVRRELYNLETDAGELDNLVDTGMAIQEQQEQQLTETVGRGLAPDAGLTDEERERLRSLGYIQ